MMSWVIPYLERNFFLFAWVSTYGNDIVIDQILCEVLIVLKCVLLRCVFFSREEFN